MHLKLARQRRDIIPALPFAATVAPPLPPSRGKVRSTRASAAKARSVRLAIYAFLGAIRLERFLIAWNHVIEKESLKFKELEHVLVEKVEQLFRDVLSVFCALSLLSLSGQFVRFGYGGDVASDAFIVILHRYLALLSWVFFFWVSSHERRNGAQDCGRLWQ